MMPLRILSSPWWYHIRAPSRMETRRLGWLHKQTTLVSCVCACLKRNANDMSQSVNQDKRAAAMWSTETAGLAYPVKKRVAIPPPPQKKTLCFPLCLISPPCAPQGLGRTGRTAGVSQQTHGPIANALRDRSNAQPTNPIEILLTSPIKIPLADEKGKKTNHSVHTHTLFLSVKKKTCLETGSETMGSSSQALGPAVENHSTIPICFRWT